LLDVNWDVDHKQQFLAQIKVVGQERKNFLKDITDMISTTNTNIISIDGSVDDTIIHISFVLQVGNLNHLNRIIAKIRTVQGIITVERK
jgi:GTP pyrophosphokinase